VPCQGSNAACSLALKPDGVVASRRHSLSYDSSSRLASGLDGGAIKRHLSPDTTPEPYKLSISAHRGRHFRLIVDGISTGSWTAFQSDRGRRFSGIVDDGDGAQVIF
jgi:hypothetical protein